VSGKIVLRMAAMAGGGPIAGSVAQSVEQNRCWSCQRRDRGFARRGRHHRSQLAARRWPVQAVGTAMGTVDAVHRAFLVAIAACMAKTLE
jgi:hypothetical protein